MRMIELNNASNGSYVYLHAETICYLQRPFGEDYTLVVMGPNELELQVRETPHQITRLIIDAPEL
jgi:hypothetical protein